MRILIVKRDKLGDMLLTTPLISHLAHARPDAELCVLAPEYCSWVVREDRHLAQVWSYPQLRGASLFSPAKLLRYARTMNEVRGRKFDVAIAAGGEYSPRAVEKTLAARASRTIAYAPADHRFGARLTDRLDPPRRGHEAERMLALAIPLGVPPPARELSPEYRLPDRARAFARAWLHARGLVPGRYVVIGLGARRARRQPSTQQVLRWSTAWREDYSMQTVFMWTPGRGTPLYPGDDAIAEPVLAAARPEIHPYRGPIEEALGLIFAAAASVFPDSGLMHFAAASPGGVVGLFAGDPAWPEQWAPRGPRAKWILARDAVRDLPDEAVHGALRELLTAGSSPARGGER